MWKIAIATAVAILSATPNASLYATTFVVSEVKYASDEVIFWDMYTKQQRAYPGADDWNKGDLVACIMSDNGTENVADDPILSAKYAGLRIDLGEELTCGNEY